MSLERAKEEEKGRVSDAFLLSFFLLSNFGYALRPSFSSRNRCARTYSVLSLRKQEPKNERKEEAKPSATRLGRALFFAATLDARGRGTNSSTSGESSELKHGENKRIREVSLRQASFEEGDETRALEKEKERRTFPIKAPVAQSPPV